jgi:UDP-N-acetylmuramoylalanine--D-glutamate ligase
MMREPAFRLLPQPAPQPLVGRRVLVLGLGDTGLSVARWVAREGGKVRAADTRAQPPRAPDYRGELVTGPFTRALLDDVDLVCVSPGLALEQEVVRDAVASGIPVIGDIELFAWHAAGPVMAVTGTNGKSTVTALAAHLASEAGIDCAAAGNIGPPVLDALLSRLEGGRPPRAWALELSSYQLETAWSLNPRAATMLNLSEDHLDRYAGLADYAAAKARVFLGTGTQVLNRDDAASRGMAQRGRDVVTFGLDAPQRPRDFGVASGFLAMGDERILPAAELPIHGAHNVANALAACALVSVLKISPREMGRGLKTFRGLPHRLELVAENRGVRWYDDSKGTNVGATIAALRGLGRRAVLILGGDGKGQDFSALAGPVREFAAHVLLIGRDAPLIAKVTGGERCASLEQAVQRAASLAKPGEAVLLSPACASFDMFRDYKHRGQVFAAEVLRLS